MVKTTPSDIRGSRRDRLQHDPDFAGPLKNRSCTDLLCLLLFIVFLFCWAIVAVYAFRTGDPEKLIVPTDSKGLKCGVDPGVEDKKYLFFFDITKCAVKTNILKGCQTPQVCVKSCPDRIFYYTDWIPGDTSAPQPICLYDVDIKTITSETLPTLVERNECAAWYVNSTSLAGRCIPSDLKLPPEIAENIENIADNLEEGLKGLAEFSKAKEVGEMIFQDVVLSWPMIVGALVLAMVVCLIYIIIMRWLAGIMVWFSLIAVIVLLAFCVYASYEKYASLKDQEDNPAQVTENIFRLNFSPILEMKGTWLTFLIASAIVLVIILLMVIFLRSRIIIAIALIKEASRAVGNSISSLFFPIFPWILECAVLLFAVTIGLYLASSGEKIYSVMKLNGTSTETENCLCIGNYTVGGECDPGTFKKECKAAGNDCMDLVCSFYKYQTADYIGWLHFYNIFAFFWGIFFVSAFGEMVLAGTFATWYWTYKKSDVPSFTLVRSLCRTVRYHLGTLAFGSLIIAICRMIRVMLEYIDHKLKKYDNKLVKCILCCLKCCFWCLEKFLKFINRNAYIMCAVHGKNFCASARGAFFLLMRNVIRVVVLDKVTDFLFFLGKIMIVAAMCAASFYVFSGKIDFLEGHVPDLHYYFVPIIIIGIGTYFIATIFFGVYSMAVDTLFLCFLEDCERNDGSADKPYYMPKRLMKILGKKNKFQ